MRKKIGNKIALLIGLVEIIAMTILFLVMNQNLTRILEAKAIHDMNVIACDRAQIVETYIADCVDFLNGYAKATENREVLEHPDDPAYIKASRDYTDLYAEGYTDIEGLYVAKWDTYVLSHTNPDSVDQTFRDAESAKALEDMIRLNDRPFCTGIVQAPVTKDMVIPVYAPIKNLSGVPIGFAGAAFYSDMLVDKLNAVSDEEMPGVGYSLINVATGVYIFDNDPSLAGTECTDQDLLSYAVSLQSGGGDDNSLSYSSGNDVMCCYYMADRDWVFVVRDTKNDIFGVINTVRIWLIIICLVITAVMVIICMISVNRQMKPMTTINSAIERLKANDFSKDPLIDECCKRKDEFGTISNAVQELYSALENQYELFYEMLESQSVGTLVLSAEEENIVMINRMALELFGLSDESREGLRISDIRARFDEEENAHIKENLDEIRNSNTEITFEERVNRDDGTNIVLLARAKGIILSNNDRVIIVSLTDITEQKKLEESLKILSETDSLTSICNRRSGEYRIGENMKNGLLGMFCLFDVDKFKYVNDNYGHATGDALLIGIARTMQKTFRTSDTLIRLGGDEFVVFATGIQDTALGSRVLDRFMGNIAAMDIPELQGHKITISLGAVIATEPENFSSMYEKADSLMYDVKKKTGNAYIFFSEKT